MFEQPDVDALANRALDVLRRSTNPRLSKLGPTDAVNFVYAHQFGETTFDFKTNASSLTGGHQWQWLAASRYKTTPSRPKILRVTGRVSHDTGQLDDGTKTPFLVVTIQAHIVQSIHTVDDGTVPIVARRTVAASAFRPRGGEQWWPEVLTRTTPFGNDGCALYSDSALVPATRPDELRRDLSDLEISLKSDIVVPEDFGGGDGSNQVRDYLAKNCT